MNSKTLLTSAATLSVFLVAEQAQAAATFEVGFQEVVASEEFDVKSKAFGASTPGRYYHISV